MAGQIPQGPRFVVHQASIPQAGNVTLRMDEETGESWILLRSYQDRLAFHWEKVADQGPEGAQQERPQPV
jgi:hypothetical protein